MNNQLNQTIYLSQKVSKNSMQHFINFFNEKTSDREYFFKIQNEIYRQLKDLFPYTVLNLSFIKYEIYQEDDNSYLIYALLDISDVVIDKDVTFTLFKYKQQYLKDKVVFELITVIDEIHYKSYFFVNDILSLNFLTKEQSLNFLHYVLNYNTHFNKILENNMSELKKIDNHLYKTRYEDVKVTKNNLFSVFSFSKKQMRELTLEEKINIHYENVLNTLNNLEVASFVKNKTSYQQELDSISSQLEKIKYKLIFSMRDDFSILHQLIVQILYRECKQLLFTIKEDEVMIHSLQIKLNEFEELVMEFQLFLENL